jgi:hypothetical protein
MIDDDWVKELRAAIDSEQPPAAKTISRWRTRFGVDGAMILEDSVRLQSRAVEKLGPGCWWFTDRSLQQSTPWQVAKLKASWFQQESVLDLCSGLGGDLMWLARRGETTAVDHDPLMVSLATANLKNVVNAHPNVRVVCLEAALAIDDKRRWLHIDPDRRPGERRVSRPESYEPNWSQLVRHANQAPGAVVKLAPAAEVELSELSVSATRVWISLAGSVREQSLVTGASVQAAGFTPSTSVAIRISKQGDYYVYSPASISYGSRYSSEPLEWIIDIDPAIRAAKLTDSFASEHSLSIIGGSSGFLTTDVAPKPNQWLMAAKVHWFGWLDRKRLKRQFRHENVYPSVIKTRGARIDVARWTKEFRECGDTPVTLWIGRIANRTYAAYSMV